MYLAQCYTDIEQAIRLNSNYMILYHPKTKRNMKMILRENFVDEDAFKNLNGEEHKHDFLFIDKNCNKYYKNFDEDI